MRIIFGYIRPYKNISISSLAINKVWQAYGIYDFLKRISATTQVGLLMKAAQFQGMIGDKDK